MNRYRGEHGGGSGGRGRGRRGRGRGRGRGGGGRGGGGRGGGGRGGGGFNWQKYRDRSIAMKNKTPEEREEFRTERKREALNELANMGISVDKQPKSKSHDGNDVGPKKDIRIHDSTPEEVTLKDHNRKMLRDAISRISGSLPNSQSPSENRNIEGNIRQKNEKFSKTPLATSWDSCEPGSNPKLADIRRALPIFSRRSEILDAILKNQVVVISGETGSGKTTQIPQYILEDSFKHNRYCNIICTQPRRISAIAAADRVADEQGQETGKLTGYQIRLERETGEDTRLLFCTTGILLRKLHLDPDLDHVTHVIIDEVHERSVESDFLIIILKDLLIKRPTLKVVLMSATLNAETFSTYFSYENVAVEENDDETMDESKKTGGEDAWHDNTAEKVEALGGDNVADDWEDIEVDWESIKRSKVNAEKEKDSSAQTDPAVVLGSSRKGKRLRDVPVVSIAGRTFNVDDFYLEDAIELTKIAIDDMRIERNRKPRKGGRRRIDSRNDNNDAERKKQYYRWATSREGEYSQRTIETLTEGFNEKEIPVKLIVKLAAYIHKHHSEMDGAILVFLPGWEDIKKVHEELQKHPMSREMSIHPLHGMLGTEKQRHVFKPPPMGQRKIVLATNIAESSITIDDVVYVIDACKHKEKTYDAESNIACLMPTYISKASAKQRRGRAGRVRAGKCFHLVPSKMMQTEFADYALPEIMRTPLEQLCLQVRAMDLAVPGSGGISDFLNKAISPPSAQAAENAVTLLKTIGALTVSSENDNSILDEELTPLGRILSVLPMSPQIGKSLVMACIVGCLDPVLTVTSLLSQRSIFVSPLEKQYEADRAKFNLSRGHPSDHKTMLNAYMEWEKSKHSDNGQRDFAFRNYLSHSQLLKAKETRGQFRQLLKDAALLRENHPDALNRHSSNWLAVKACLAAGLYPNLVRLDPSRRTTNLYIPDHGTVKVHPASVLNKQLNHVDFVHRWGMYHEKVKTVSGIFVYDLSPVSPLSILLFSSSKLRSSDKLSEIVGFEATNKSATEGNETLRLVTEIIHAKGGEIGLAKLSRLLKQVHPGFRSEMESGIQRFLEIHGFKIDKKQGTRMVYGKNANSETENSRFKLFLSASDWVYFGCNDKDTALMIEQSRETLSYMFKVKFDNTGKQQPPKGDWDSAFDEFVDAVISCL